MQSSFEQELAAKIDGKTKPPRSLGKLEVLAAQLARIQNTLSPRVESCSLTIFAADHGIAVSGVSAFPQEVTRQMVTNFLARGAAANAFADAFSVPVTIVDAGVVGPPVEHPDLVDARIGAGTANSLKAPAMTAEQYEMALQRGLQIGAVQEADACCFGEMGIGNTSSASLVGAKILSRPVSELVGRGTGLDDEGLERKRQLLARASERTAQTLQAGDALREYGGFEMVMMTGAMIGAAQKDRVVLVDGVIATTAALCAQALEPGCSRNQIFAHRSAEASHGPLLEALGSDPLLDLDMRLGEGTGALLAWPLVKAAAAFLSKMASFDDAGVNSGG